MPALIEMILGAGDGWADDSYNTWLDDAYNTWTDSAITVNASHHGYVGDKYWEPFVIDLTPPQFRLDHPSGGYCKLGFGDLTLSLETFKAASIWPPPESCPVNIYYALDSGASLLFQYLYGDPPPVATITQLFTGTMHRQKLSRDGIVYQLYERTFDAMLLEEIADYDDNIVPLPRAFGTIVHQQPVRLPDAGGGNRRYSAGSLQGTKDVDWHVYDDGVDICSNATAISANVFELTATPVGEVTVSGTGEDTLLADIFEWACGSARLNLSYSSTKSTEVTIGYWANSQMVLIEFLDGLAQYASHLFYILDETLYLVDMDSDNGDTLTFPEDLFFPASIVFAAPVSLLKTEWTDRAAVEETIGKYIKETPKSITVYGEHPYGSEESITNYCTNKISDATIALNRVLGYMMAPRWEAEIPIAGYYPLPGQKITAVDASMGQSVTTVIRLRDIEYNYDEHTIRIAGEGTVA